MCNFFRNQKYGLTDWTEDFSQIRLPLRFPDPLPNLPEEFRPTDPAYVFRAVEGAQPSLGLEAVAMRWDQIPWYWTQPVKAKRFLATNARSETVATTAAFKTAFACRRCLIPADGFFEWTGGKGRKTPWLFTVAGQPRFCFAGLWDHARTADGQVDSFTMLTTAAGEDMKPYHARQPVILSRETWLPWLDRSADPNRLFEPSAAGTLNVEQVSPEAG